MSLLPDTVTQWLAKWRINGCDHKLVMQNGAFCPDCGHKILMEWAFVRCASCNVKRPPQRQLGVHNYKAEAIKPLQKHCKHCGSAEFNVVKKPAIDAFELLFALPLKVIDPSAKPIAPQLSQSAPSTSDQFISQQLAPAANQLGGVSTDKINASASASGSAAAQQKPTFAFSSKPQMKNSPYLWQPNRQMLKNSTEANPTG
jgi:hypothetical protein